MICMSRLRRRSASEPSDNRSCPRKLTVPEVGSISLRIQRPIVDLPHPDSPTNPKVSPLLMLKLTSSTAFTTTSPAPNSPALVGKYFLRLFTSIRLPLFSIDNHAIGIRDRANAEIPRTAVGGSFRSSLQQKPTQITLLLLFSSRLRGKSNNGRAARSSLCSLDLK